MDGADVVALAFDRKDRLRAMEVYFPVVVAHASSLRVLCIQLDSKKRRESMFSLIFTQFTAIFSLMFSLTPFFGDEGK
jgi:hypothetical protein